MSFRKIFLTSLLTFCSAATALAEGVPALKVTAPNGQTSIMIGTLHVPYPGLVQPAPTLLNGRKRLVVEGSVTQGPQPKAPSLSELLDPEAYQAFNAGLGFKRAPWAAHLTEEQTNRLLHGVQCLMPSMTPELFEMFLAHRTARAVSVFAYLRCGPEWGSSRDEILAQAATARGIPTDILETQVDMDRRRKAVPPRYYESALADAFAPDVEDRFRMVVQALNRGDYAEVLAATQGRPRYPEDAEEHNRLMLVERNVEWIAPLRRYLDEGNAVVAVGAGHLPGPHGLIALLRRDGYQVDPTVVPAQ